MAAFPEQQLQSIRADFPLLSKWTYLNTGTVGLMPQPVLDAHLKNIADYEVGGHVAQARAVDGYETARDRIARLLGVPASEITFNRNATDGINLVAAQFPLSPGDEVITSTEEHPAMVVPWLAACHRSGATLKFISATPDRDEFAANVRETFNRSTRIIAISHVSCETGTRMPVEMIRDIVGGGASILIDASQSIGQFAVSVPQLRADFVIGNGHKWLGGPKGTGFAWISPQAMHLAPPVHFAGETIDPSWSRVQYQHGGPVEIGIAQSHQRYEFGTRAWHLYGALGDAIDYLERLGWNAIEAHSAYMAEHLKQALTEVPGVTLHSPESWDDASGLVTFSMSGWSGEDLSSRLWNEYQIVQRRVEQPSAVRVSCAFFTTTADIDALLGALNSVRQ